MTTPRHQGNSPTRAGGLVRPGLTTAQLPAIEMDARSGYDFLASACLECGELEDLLPEDRHWLEESRAALTAQMGSETFVRTCTGFVAEIGRMLIEHPEIRTARELVDAIDKMTDRELLETMVGELLEDSDLGALTRRAIDGDAGAYAELEAKLDSYKGHPVLPRSGAELVPLARAVVKFWLPRYEPIEAHIGRMLERDVAARHQEDAVRDPIGFVERTTNGIRYVPEPRIRRIVMAPTYFGRPYNSLTKVGDVQLICYPIADSALGAADRLDPPAATLRLYRALGDDSRLRILRLLAERDRYLTELANELGLSKPTLSHHMAQLRSAGLVTISEQGNLTYYTLRRDRTDEAGPELSAYLAH
jgi:DNA-binding transcriptional ArsR family regulator